jgi:ketosteroid isomerase-like protein
MAEHDIRAVMEAWRQAMIRSDGAALERLYHPDLRYGHSNGQIDPKPRLIEQVLRTKVEAVDLADMSITVKGNVALVHATVHFKEVHAGQPTDITVVALHVWLNGAQGWQLIGRQATRAPQAP